ncbi:ribonuclease H-like domain-containing protein [Thamnocephalis sphaerospora]|uniref:Ribonuclease H-like domain-containing protein n=1 Tax=Thamnocephalis sphaerospora TaxID=78915 RepID=A0A4P9XV77_9FUNG|nr:ribonuclease H-like domain-containing protein [Thamnocephalis sphaerospora]|eukprot:RKP10165.1 ribonuclease H-like domain-containing protein [Thamnocephalis sphaerospora]
MNRRVDPVENFDEFANGLFASLIRSTQLANAVPNSDDLSFYRMLNRPLGTALDSCGEEILEMCNSLLKFSGARLSEPFEELDDVTDRFGEVIDVVDNLLEKADVCLDEMTGKADRAANRHAAIVQGAPSVAKMSQSNLDYHLIHAQNIVRPQLRFGDTIDNSNNVPFVPKIKSKPNAQVPLGYGKLALTVDWLVQTVAPHPYDYELQHISYPEKLLEIHPETPYTLFEDTDAIWVDTTAALQTMIVELKKATEIAVDLEAHDYRSFQGFTCLMQISTRTQDYLVDTLALRSDLHLINDVFTDPKITKVFHGADSDIVWLQRDFGVYVVGLFDTYQAARLLSYEKLSLAYLLKRFANFDADKRYQLADWRIRPLPQEMLKYARSDTHYLLYIFDRMRNELLEKSNPETKNLLHATLDRSQETALKRYEKEMYDAEHGEGPGGWRNLLSKWNRAMNAQQLEVFKALHAWRDRTARDEDESVRYVLPNHMLFTLAERMPSEAAGVIGCCSPIPPLVRMYASDLAQVIQYAREDADRHLASKAAQVREQVEADAKKVAAHIRFGDAAVSGTGEYIQATA